MFHFTPDFSRESLLLLIVFGNRFLQMECHFLAILGFLFFGSAI